MARTVGLLLLKRDRPDLRAIIDKFLQLMQVVGGYVPPPATPLPPHPLPGGHTPTQVVGDRVWTPEGLAPDDLSDAIMYYFSRDIWTDAARVSYYESVGWRRDAALDTRHYAGGRCNVPYVHPQFGNATTEYSIGYFQINSCAHGGTFAYWTNARNNVKKASELYDESGWRPWVLTARRLGLL